MITILNTKLLRKEHPEWRWVAIHIGFTEWVYRGTSDRWSYPVEVSFGVLNGKKDWYVSAYGRPTERFDTWNAD